MSSGHIRYRPEIDGLRAVCVVGVILFHAGIQLNGGFVGVDVFFVISGFLITKIIDRELREGRFSLAAFWERRLRRIYPALLLMQVATLALGICLYLPDDLDALGKASLYLSTSIPNIYYWRSLNYFLGYPVLKPMLHTWSLGVEEQFYIVFPLLLMALIRLFPGRLVRVLGLLGLASFGLNLLFMNRYDTQAAFYLLPMRAWELLAGCLLAMTNPLANLSARGREAGSALGLGLILGSMVTFWETMGFPGHWAAIPVLGGWLFIAANESGITRAARPLAHPAVVGIGKISYSLYLWHWPLIVFPKLFLADFLGLRVVLMVAMLPVSYIAWRYLEGPIRTKQVLASRRSMFAMFLVSNGVMMSLAAFIVITGGMKFRLQALPENVRREVNVASDRTAKLKFASQSQFLAGKPAAVGDAGASEVRFLVWGDSHAKMTAEALDKAARAERLRGEIVAEDGVNIVPRRDPDSYATFIGIGGLNTPEMRDRMLDEIARRRIEHLVLVSYWVNALNYPEAAGDFADLLAAIARKCPETQVHVIDDVPSQNYPSRGTLYQLVLVNVLPGFYTYRPTDEAAYARTMEPVRAGIAAANHPNLVRHGIDGRTLDPSGHYLYMDDQRFLFKDSHHLTPLGVERYYGQPVEELMRQIARKPGPANQP